MLFFMKYLFEHMTMKNIIIITGTLKKKKEKRI
jgi:hypothetical protein